MPIQKPWDHAIDLKEGFELKKAKVYLLFLEKRKEVIVFVENQLAKGYIRPSKSLQTSSVFFVLKKDSKKCMVRNYQYLNSWTVRNNYPIPLISELIDKLVDKKHFMKMDL